MRNNNYAIFILIYVFLISNMPWQFHLTYWIIIILFKSYLVRVSQGCTEKEKNLQRFPIAYLNNYKFPSLLSTAPALAMTSIYSSLHRQIWKSFTFLSVPAADFLIIVCWCHYCPKSTWFLVVLLTPNSKCLT
jgi:hypothetical protein